MESVWLQLMGESSSKRGAWSEIAYSIDLTKGRSGLSMIK